MGFWALRFKDFVRGVAEKAEGVGGEDKPEKGERQLGISIFLLVTCRL